MCFVDFLNYQHSLNFEYRCDSAVFFLFTLKFWHHRFDILYIWNYVKECLAGLQCTTCSSAKHNLLWSNKYHTCNTCIVILSWINYEFISALYNAQVLGCCFGVLLSQLVDTSSDGHCCHKFYISPSKWQVNIILTIM